MAKKRKQQMRGGTVQVTVNRFGEVSGTPLLPEWALIVEETEGVRRIWNPDRSILLFEKSLEEIERMKEEERQFREDVEFYAAFHGSNPDNDQIVIQDAGVATGENAIWTQPN